MKKKLLLSSMFALTALSGFALENGEFLYTPQGRFKITDATNGFNASIAPGFAGFEAFKVGDNGVDAVFTTGEDAAVGSYFQTKSTAADSVGIAYKMNLGGGKTYVVSFLVKSSSIMSTHDWACSHMGLTGMNKIMVYSTAKDAGASGEVAETYSAESTIGTEWVRLSFNVSDVDVSKDYYISFFGLNSAVCVADIQINEAKQVADLRKLEYTKSFVEAYLNLKTWGEDVEDATGLAENYGTLCKVTDESTQAQLDEAVEGVMNSIEILRSEKFVDSWLGDGYLNTWGVDDNKTQRQTEHGIWTFMVDQNALGRLHLEGDYVIDETTGQATNKLITPSYFEGPHYAGSLGYSNAGIETTNFQKFPEGNYVFAISLNGTSRNVHTSSCWDNDNGLNAFNAQLYVLNETGDTVAITEPYVLPTGSNLPTTNRKPIFLKWAINKEGNYKVGVIAKPVDGVTLNGGTVTFMDATLDFVSTSLYTKGQLSYIADVLEQITTGRDNITTATANIGSDEDFWGKAELQACLDTAVSKFEAYEALDTVAIIDTYFEEYVKSTTDPDKGALVYEIYQEAVKDLIAANRKFKESNDILRNLSGAIEKAKALQKNRVYAKSTKPADLQTGIDDAEALLADLKTKDYSEENAELVTSGIADLDSIGGVYKNAVPENMLTTLVDIDFEQEATLTDASNDYATVAGPATISGNLGTMEFASYQKVTGTSSFTKGFDNNGEPLCKGMLRIGNGDGIVKFDAGEIGSDIIAVSMDIWYGNYNKHASGFCVLDENDQQISGLMLNAYDNNFTYNPCGLDLGYRTQVGGSGTENEKIAVDNNRTSITLYLDYGTKKAQIVTSNPQKGEYQTEWTSFDGTPITQFVVRSNYDNAGRRSWFDNLKIYKISADALQFTPGDVNDDTKISVADANLVVNYYLADEVGKSEMVQNGFNTDAADMNGDSTISISDANMIVNTYLEE